MTLFGIVFVLIILSMVLAPQNEDVVTDRLCAAYYGYRSQVGVIPEVEQICRAFEQVSPGP